jgi:hypothetical protein
MLSMGAAGAGSWSATGSAIVALADRVPNEEALELAPVAGWIMLLCAICAATILITQREGWRRLFLRAEDPRSIALFRIAFGLCAMANVNGLWELHTYLFTDEGLFLTDVAREVFAREQFEGFGNGLDGDPYGFFDLHAFLQWLEGPKYSLLFFWDSPSAFRLHWVAFQAAITCLVLGLGTRYTKWIAWFLFHGITLRNGIFWEGTENVYRTFFFYLCLSQCDRAYSLDNWWRCRRLRRARRLSERGGPGGGAGLAPDDAYPGGLEPVYRLIPAWPRILVILQCAALYCYTGAVKNGAVWWRGDAFYYALNLDHFYRLPPQQLSAWFGTNLFRVSTHVVHAWETLFPLVVFGLVVRWGLRERLPPLPRHERWVHRGAWIGLGLGALALVVWLYPVHYAAPRGSWWSLERVQVAFAIGWILGMALIAWGWHRLRHRPFRPKLLGRVRTLDLDTFCKWAFGRRVWVFVGICFHLHLMVLMNIGWFQPGALTGFICFLNGGEVALALTLVARGLARTGMPWLPDWVRRGEDPLPAADPTLPDHVRDDARLPVASMVLALAMAVAGVVLQSQEILHFGWMLVAIGVFLAASMWRAARSAHETGLRIVPRPPAGTRLDPAEATAPWAHRPLGRFLASTLTIFQIVGVGCWLLPDKDSFTWRTQTHEPFSWWLKITHTTQGWKMFAPNPPRSNLFLKVLITDAQGEVFDMKTDVYAQEQRPLPWIWYTRQRKINRRVAGSEGGGGSWYQKWHARWFCRKWQLDNEGEIPQKVELVKITYPIPSPEEVAEHGPYDPVERLRTMGKYEVIYTARCRTEVDAQLPNAIRTRHGIEPLEEGIRRWSRLRGKKRRWDERKDD